MKQMKVFMMFMVVLGVIGIFSCQKEPLTTDQSATTAKADDRAAKNCFNFTFEQDGLLVGCACVPAPLACEGMDTICGFGAKTFEVTLGDYEGTMTSVVTDMRQMGNPPTGNGSLHLTLVHYFVSDDGQDAFWTEDQAICAPGSDPASCIINDVLNIAGGCGDFENVSGKLINHALLTFNGGVETCGGVDVPTGTIDVYVHGRICLNN